MTSIIESKHCDTFWQQNLRACRPNLDAYPTTFFLAFSLVHIAITFFLAAISLGWSSAKVRYDNVCKIGETCVLNFTIPKTLPAPVHMYYELDKYFQNHYRVRHSVSFSQLYGSPNSTISDMDCDPFYYLDENKTIPAAPCGLRAKYAWQDDYQMENFSTKDISWTNEIGNLYKPLNPIYTKESRWLESIPGYENGTQSEKFAVWMRTAPVPHFTKLYARSKNNLVAGTYNLTVVMGTDPAIYTGKRYVTFVSLSSAGGRNFTLISLNGGFSIVYVILALISESIQLCASKKR